jgi:5-methylcytosine-specific restriction endonuclease McrA
MPGHRAFAPEREGETRRSWRAAVSPVLKPGRADRERSEEGAGPAEDNQAGRRLPNASTHRGKGVVPAPSSQNGARCLAPRTAMSILRLCPKCGVTLDPQVEGHRGPCRRCEQERSRQRRAAGEPGVLIRSTAQWQRTREAALHLDGRRCTACGASGRLEVHVRPLRQAGEPFDPRNLRKLCSSCHQRQERERRPVS